MKFNLTLLFTLLVIGFSACEKHRFDKIPVTEPYILYFDSPLKDATFSTGDSIKISGMAIYKQSIHGYDIKLREVNDTSLLYFTHIHDHNDTLHINHTWKNNLTGSRNIEAEIIIYLDHDGNIGSKKTSFYLQ